MAITLNITVADQPNQGGGGGPVDPPPSGGSGTSVTTTASWQGVTFTLSQACTVGYLADGKPFFVHPGSATTVSWSPAETTAGGLAVNCGWKNPDRGLKHAWDARQTSYFDATLKATSPVTMAENDSLCVCRHNPDPTAYGGRSVLALAYSSIICLAAEPAAHSYIPSVGPYANGGTQRPVYVLDVSTLTFPSYTISSSVRSMADVLVNQGLYNPTLSTPRGVEQRRTLGPLGVTTQDSYGRDLAISMAHAGARLIGNDSVADKRTLARYMMMHFAESYPSIKANASKRSADGGQTQGMLLPIILGLGWLGDTAGLATLYDDIGGNELRQSFRVTADILNRIRNPHSTVADTWPTLTLRRTISAISGTGPWTLTFTDGSSSWPPVWIGTHLTRESDGDYVVVANSSSSAKQQMIETMPDPAFEVGQVCFNRAPYTQAEGDAEWTKRGLGGLIGYDPDKDAAYRNLNEWDGQVLCAMAFGFVHSNWSYWKDYTARANAGTNPAAPYTYPDSFSSTGVKDFWNTHWAAISAVPQTVG